MSIVKLKDRIDSYQEISNFKLLNKVPLIININGRSFFKISNLLDKPFCNSLSEAFLTTMFKLCSEIEGVVFCYQNNDEFTLIIRNDQNLETEPWYDNRLQKIASVTSSIATYYFSLYGSELQLSGSPFFYSSVFNVPNIAEAINAVICKQQQNFYNSIQSACFYELLKKYDKSTIKEMISGLSIDDKISFLKQECGVDYNSYPIIFRRGAACYKVPKIIDGVVKNKWYLNRELPIFTRDESFLTNIIKNGSDIFRHDSLI